MPAFARACSACLVAVLAVAALAGCSSSARLTGTVSYNGQRLKGGNITLIPRGEGISVTQKIQEDGTFTFEKIPTGKYQVLIETESLKPPPNVAAPGAPVSPGQEQADAGVSARPAERYVAIPAKYGDRNFTPLEVVIKGGSKSQNFELTD